MRGLRFTYRLGLVLLSALVAGILIATIATRTNLQFGYPEGISTALVILFSMGAAAISFFTYDLGDGRLPRYAAIPLGVFRYAVLLVAAVMLLEPQLETRNKQLSPPVVAVLHDDSESIWINGDSTFIRGMYPDKLKAFMEKLNADGKIKTHFFAFSGGLGGDASPDSLRYRGMGTNISNALTSTAKLFSNQNLGAVVLLTDGISTSGMNPVYSLDDFQQPVYTVLLGDTSARKDIRIGDVLYNQIAYLDNETPIKVKVMNIGYDAAAARVSLAGDGKVIGTQMITLGKDQGIVDADFLVKPARTGIAQYTITVDPLPGELTTRNNSKAIFINVLETKVKIALFAGYPHPDLGALRHALVRDQRYECREFIHKTPTAFYTEPNTSHFGDFDLFILHNFPLSPADAAILQKIRNEIDGRKASVMVFVGQGTHLQTLNGSLGDRIGIVPGTFQNNVEEAMIVFRDDYRSHATYTFDEEWMRMMANSPPLFRNQSEWKSSGDTKVYATAKIRGVALDYPIYGLQNHLERKNMVFIGENIWRMRAHVMVEKGAFDDFDNWIYNNIQWLIVREDNRRFKVTPSKQLFTGNEPVLFRGEVYDESYHPMTGVDIQLKLRFPDGKQDDLYLNETGNARYFLELNNLEEGTYNYEAKGTKGGVIVGTDRGQFSIGRSNIEHLNLTADKGLLEQIALRTRGTFLMARDLDRLPDEILALSSLKPVATITIKRLGFHEFQWIFYLLAGLLAVEWVVRKRYSLN
jgi:hypothetical protein